MSLAGTDQAGIIAQPVVVPDPVKISPVSPPAKVVSKTDAKIEPVVKNFADPHNDFVFIIRFDDGSIKICNADENIKLRRNLNDDTIFTDHDIPSKTSYTVYALKKYANYVEGAKYQLNDIGELYNRVISRLEIYKDGVKVDKVDKVNNNPTIDELLNLFDDKKIKELLKDRKLLLDFITSLESSQDVFSKACLIKFYNSLVISNNKVDPICIEFLIEVVEMYNAAVKDIKFNLTNSKMKFIYLFNAIEMMKVLGYEHDKLHTDRSSKFKSGIDTPITKINAFYTTYLKDENFSSMSTVDSVVNKIMETYREIKDKKLIVLMNSSKRDTRPDPIALANKYMKQSNTDEWEAKYMKYKQKYLQFKKEHNL